MADPAITDLSMLRPVIARSWQRSVSCNVSAAPAALASVSDPRVDEQLLLAAEPVLAELERVCIEVGGSFALTDADGTLAMIRGHANAVLRAEQMFPLSGVPMAEDLVGTNSHGTAVEENRAVQVWGAEHFNEALKSNYCTSVPIRDPIRRSIRGVLGLTLPESVARDAAPRSILLLVEGAAADITRRLAERLAAREQALLAEYMREVRKRGADAVIAMDNRTAIASRSALSMLDQSDFAVLAALARDADSGHDERLSLSISGGREVSLHMRPMEGSQFRSGGAAVIRMRVPDERSGSSNAYRALEPARQFSSMVGDSPALRRSLEAAGTAVTRKMPAYIVGENGTGKRMLAEEIARAISPDVVFVDFPSARRLAELVDEVDAALVSGAAVVLHRVDRAPASLVAELAGFLHLLEQAQVVVTAGAITDDVMPIVSALRGIEITMPPLRSMREDVPTLCRTFLDRVGNVEMRLSPKLRDALVTADWPGNVQQLRTLIETVAADASVSELRLSDLSDMQRRALQVSRLSRLEEAELQQIRQALTEAAGNRVRAASLLGIGRSTLYRKIETYAARGFSTEFE